jgi:hypothetical protein
MGSPGQMPANSAAIILAGGDASVLNVLRQMGVRPAWAESFVRRRVISHYATGGARNGDSIM